MVPDLNHHGDTLKTLTEQCYASAYKALNEGDTASAKGLFLIMTIMAARDERAWLGFAKCYEQEGNVRAAAGIYEAGSAVVEQPSLCRLGLAKAMSTLGRPARAQRELDAAEQQTQDPWILAAIADERRAS